MAATSFIHGNTVGTGAMAALDAAARLSPSPEAARPIGSGGETQDLVPAKILTVTPGGTSPASTHASLTDRNMEISPNIVKDDGVFLCEEKLQSYESFIDNDDLEDLLQVQFNKLILTIPEATPNSTEEPIKKIETNNTEQTNSLKPIINVQSRKYLMKIFDEIGANELFISYHKKKMPTSSYDKSDKIHLTNFGNSAKSINRQTLKDMHKMNIFDREFAKQYLNIDGSKVLLSGSLGANWKELSYSIQHPRLLKKSNSQTKSPKLKNKPLPNSAPLLSKSKLRRGLLSSMKINFKPGPLSKKPTLDETINTGMGNVELVKLPTIGLTVCPQVGMAVDYRVSNYLKRTRDPSGYIDAQWAAFAVSTVQTSAENNTSDRDYHTFILPYENNRSKMLMRRDLELPKNLTCDRVAKDKRSLSDFDLYSYLENLDDYRGNDDIDSAVKCVMVDMLKSVAISEMQDIFAIEDPDNNYIEENVAVNEEKSIITKKKSGKYAYELKKLNVTVIDIEEDSQDKITECKKLYCKLGCVCLSLKNTYLLNEHCGLPECMLNCTCNLGYISDDNIRTDNKISSLAVINLQHQMNRNLSKEEKKFQQTIIRSNDQTIVLGARRRGIKLPKKFEEYTTLSLSEIYEQEKTYALKTDLKVLLPKLPEKIECEHWCMVHGLYRCFCKGQYSHGDLDYHSTCSISKKRDCESVVSQCSLVEECESSLLIPSDNKTSKPNVTKKRRINTQCSVVSRYFLAKKCNSPLLNINDKRSKPNIIKKKKLGGQSSDEPVNKKIKNTVEPSLPVVKLGTISVENKLNNEKRTKKDNTSQPLVHCKDPLLDKKLVDAILKNKNLNAPDGAKYVTKLYPPKNECVILSWCSLMGNFLLGKIYIWLSIERPYIPNITLNKEANFPYKCIMIAESDATLRSFYPKFVTDIYNKLILENTYVILIGKEYAWKINSIYCWKTFENSVEVKKPGFTKMSPNRSKASENSENCFTNLSITTGETSSLNILKKQLTSPISKELSNSMVSKKYIFTNNKFLRLKPVKLKKNTQDSQVVQTDASHQLDQFRDLNANANHENDSPVTLESLLKKISPPPNFANSYPIIDNNTVKKIKSPENTNRLVIAESRLKTDSLTTIAPSEESVTSSELFNNKLSSEGNVDAMQKNNSSTNQASTSAAPVEQTKSLENVIKISDVRSMIVPTENDVLVNDAKESELEPKKKVVHLKWSKHLAKRWFQINICDDFEYIEIPSKKFIVDYNKLLRSTEISLKESQICRLLSLNKTFGSYAVPFISHNQSNKIFLGPYMPGEKADVTFKLKDKQYSQKSSGYWLQPRMSENMKILSALNDASRDITKYMVPVKTQSRLLNTSATANQTPNSSKTINLDYDMATLTVQNVDSDVITPDNNIKTPQANKTSSPMVSKNDGDNNNNGDDDDVVVVTNNSEQIFEISDSE